MNGGPVGLIQRIHNPVRSSVCHSHVAAVAIRDIFHDLR
jgi:hypothetical protein